MSEETTLKDNQFEVTFQDGKVVVTVIRDDFFNIKMGGEDVRGETLMWVNKPLFEELHAKVVEFNKIRDRIMKERREAEKREALKKAIAEVETFKKLITESAPELMKLNPQFAEPKPDDYWRGNETVIFHSGGQRIELTNDPTVMGEWHRHKTNKPWIVEDTHFHKIRYKTIKKASVRVIELYNQYKTAAEEKAKKRNEFEAFAESVGMQLSKTYKMWGRKYSEGYEIHILKAEGITLELSRFEPIHVVKAIIEPKPDNKVNVFGVKAKTVELEVNLSTPEEIRIFLMKIADTITEN